jgi:hypothetical protein
MMQMSLVLFYRDCFTGDTKIINTHDGEHELYHDRHKVYLSEDKRFAGMACGMVPNLAQWKEIRDIIDLYKLGLQDKTDKVEKQINLDKTIKVLDEIVSSTWSSSSMAFVLGPLFIGYSYTPTNKGKIEALNPNIPIVHGSGKFAATVLINSKKQLSQKEFFKIVSYSDPDVSAEYEYVELKDVIDSYWYKG